MKVKFVLLMMLSAVLLMVFVMMSAGEAQAKPDWVGVKIKSWKIVRGSGKNVGEPNYYNLYLEITHTNNSRDRVVTALYEKTGQVTITRDFVLKSASTNWRAINARAFSVVKINYAGTNNVDLTPGESKTLIYNIPINHCDSGVPYNWTWSESNKLLGSGGWKISKWNYDVSVKSKRE